MTVVATSPESPAAGSVTTPVPPLAGFTVGVTSSRRAEERGTAPRRHRAAIRASGLSDAWSPGSESSAEVLEYRLERGVEGALIAVQLHGEPLPDVVQARSCRGAGVVEILVHRWEPPVDLGPMDRLTDAVLGRCVDILAFTSAPAGLLARARERGIGDPLVDALRGPVPAWCVGPVTAGPLDAVAVPTVQPQRSRLGAMVRRSEAELPLGAWILPVAGHTVELRGQAIVVDGCPRPVAPTGMALLQALTRHPGRVVTRAELRHRLPGSSADEHAVETAMTRLRAAHGGATIVQTVVKRGYRPAPDH